MLTLLRGPALLVSAFVVALLAAPIARADGRADPLRVDPTATDWAELLGPPPEPGSATARKDLAVVLWVQRTRSGADVDRVWAAMSPNVATFQQALDTMVLPQAYPGIYRAIQEGLDAAAPIFFALKKKWNRPRPVAVDERVRPCTPTPGSGSYPSGSAALGLVAGRLLADLVPERRAAILERADEIAALRVTAGVHFPTDVDAGSKLGNAIADQILASDAWKALRLGTKTERERLSATIRAQKTDG